MTIMMRLAMIFVKVDVVFDGDEQAISKKSYWQKSNIKASKVNTWLHKQKSDLIKPSFTRFKLPLISEMQRKTE